MSTPTDTPEFWTGVCHRVLDLSGRAILHDARAALNGLALGLEVLRHDPSHEAMDRLVSSMRRDLSATADELTRMQALVAHVACDTQTRLGGALEWAAAVVDPVAARAGVTVRWPEGTAAREEAVHPRFALTLALLVMDAVGSTPRGRSCALDYDGDAARLTVAWPAGAAAVPADSADSNDRLGRAALARLPAAGATWSESDGERRVHIVLSRAD